MCWMVAIPIAMAVGQQMMSGAQSNQAVAAQNDQSRRQAINMVNTMAYNNAGLSLENQDKLDQASQDLSLKSMQKVQALGTVRAAIGEGNLEGRSMDRIQNLTEGDQIRAANGVRDNYKRDYASIFAQQLGNQTNTLNQVEQMQKSEGKVKGALEQIVDPLGIGVSKLYGLTDIGGQKLYGDKARKTLNKDSAKAGGN